MESASIVRRSLFAALVVVGPSFVACSSEDPEQAETLAGQPTGNSGAANGDASDPRPADAARADTAAAVAADSRARVIIDKMLRAYAACETYSDRGMVRVNISVGRFGNVVDQPFHTSFVRPDRLRFEHRVKTPHGQDLDVNIVWARGDEFRTNGSLLSRLLSFDFRGQEHGDAPEGPTWVSTVVSAAMVNDSIGMLMPEHVGEREVGVAALRELRHIGEEDVEGASCHKIQGTIDAKDLDRLPENPFWQFSKKMKIEATTTLWIEKERHLLLRMHRVATARPAQRAGRSRQEPRSISGGGASAVSRTTHRA